MTLREDEYERPSRGSGLATPPNRQLPCASLMGLPNWLFRLCVGSLFSGGGGVRSFESNDLRLQHSRKAFGLRLQDHQNIVYITAVSLVLKGIRREGEDI